MERYANKQNLVQLAKAVHDKYSPVATPTANGLMSAEDKVKVDGLGKTDDPTDAGPIVALSAKGWAEQDTTVGKNLLPNGDNGSTTYNGVTITRTNGVLNFNGTASGSGGRTSAFYKSQQVELSAGTYTLSTVTSGTTRLTAYVELLSDNTTIANTTNTPTFTLTEPTTVFVGCSVIDSEVYSNLTVKPQIEAGSEATSYEPYSGGAPSPSPSYPQEIRRVTGRNLTNAGSVTPSTTNMAITLVDFGEDVQIDALTLSFTANALVANQTGNAFINLQQNDGTNNYVIGSRFGLANGANNGRKSYTVTNVAVRKVLLYAYQTSYIGFTSGSIDEIQLERGTVATPYVPYGCVGVDVQSKNLLDYDAWKTSSIQRGTAVWENNGVTLTATGNDCYTIPSTRVAVTEGQTLTVSWKVDGDANGSVYVFLNGDLGVSTYRNSKNFRSLSYTIPAGGEYITFRFGVTNSGTTLRYSDIQFELGDTATEYEPYYHQTIPIPLPSRGWVAALPNGTCDTLALDGAGGYVWTLATADVVLDGNTSSSNLSVSTSENASRATYYPYGPIGISNALFLSNRFKSMPPYSGTRSVGEIWCSSVAPRMWLGLPTSVTTPSEAIAYFADHPTTVLYPLATPTTEQGYVSDMPTVPIHAAISSVDLIDLAVRCCADEGAAEISAAWGKRYESRIAALESAVATLVAAGA